MSLAKSLGLDKELGSLLIGSWVNIMLYMFEIMQVSHYSATYKKDSLWIRAGVVVALICDSVCTVVICNLLYLICISHWGDLLYLVKEPPLLWRYILATGLTALTVNTFLLYRGCRLVALVSGIAADVSVATVLIVQLVRMSKKYEIKDSPEMRGQSIIMKLGLRAIQTGAFTTVYMIVAFAIFQADPLTNGTMLVSLNSRSLSDGNSTQGSHGAPKSHTTLPQRKFKGH
ncbi:hypothetical protein RQP46_009478 [Phenoliferia psychrophenolica]